ncbi:MAG: pyridoxal-phosphate dependent enzyme [Chloroflexota bacterium]
MKVFCPICNLEKDLSPEEWRCSCGEAWEPGVSDVFEIDKGAHDIWRYRKMYGLDFEEPYFRMGSGWTPLLPFEIRGREVNFKLEYIAPTASFKDRGTEVMINILAHQGVRRIVDDSSGNAGASVAANAARAGLEADIFVPSYASPDKQAQIAVYGAQVHAISGARVNAKNAALEAVQGEATLASHAYHPGFLSGQQSLAWELWEQLDGQAPDWYVLPVGQGVHLLGVWLGFKRLLAAGLVDRLPRLVAVQPTRLAPIKNALEKGFETVPELEPSKPSIAEGLAIASPVRGGRILEAIRETGGSCITVTDEATIKAQIQLAKRGLYVEPTSATVFAALERVFEQATATEIIVLPLTGSGLKGSPGI